jgi:hypothetical protein
LKINLNIINSSILIHGKPHKISSRTKYLNLQTIKHPQKESHSKSQDCEEERIKYSINTIKVISSFFLLFTFYFLLSWHKDMNSNTSNSVNDEQFNLKALKIKREKFEYFQKCSTSPKSNHNTAAFEFLTPKAISTRNNIEKTFDNTESAISSESDRIKRTCKVKKSEKNYKEGKSRKTRKDKGVTRGTSQKIIDKKRNKLKISSDLAELQRKDIEFHAKLHSQTETLNSTQLTFVKNPVKKKSNKEEDKENIEEVKLNLNLAFDDDLTKSIEKLSESNPIINLCSPAPNHTKKIQISPKASTSKHSSPSKKHELALSPHQNKSNNTHPNTQTNANSTDSNTETLSSLRFSSYRPKKQNDQTFTKFARKMANNYKSHKSKSIYSSNNYLTDEEHAQRWQQQQQNH